MPVLYDVEVELQGNHLDFQSSRSNAKLGDLAKIDPSDSEPPAPAKPDGAAPAPPSGPAQPGPAKPAGAEENPAAAAAIRN